MEINEDQWCKERRQDVLKYLASQGIEHGQVSESPAWDEIPYTSIWAIESKKSPDWVGWWAICGDHPTDYISSKNFKEPRTAYEAIAKNWLEICQCADEGKEHPSMKITLGNKKLIQMLRSRANMFLEWVADDNNWQYD
ncbi:MAG: DUF4826 family protein [Proteobacteria bacterium]|nr:DUF4826 family protein [Pseudomonadota bacterium]